MTRPLIRVAVTGGAGQIAYSLLFRIASGEMFGKDQPVALHILEVPAALEALGGVVMELVDCSFPLLKEIKTGSDPHKVFNGVNFALLVGAKPRGPGMERKDLLTDNGKIFEGQGQALNEVADRNIRVLVVGNPCNTNCMILMHNAPNIPRDRFFAMTMLDENRARYQLAAKAGVSITEVEGVTIWGNHSATQVPDFLNAKIGGRPTTDVILNRDWLEKDFIETVQKRGAAVIKARGKSSAASAANAIVDSIHRLIHPTPKDRWYSMCVVSDKNPYGIKEGLLFSFPCITDQDGHVKIVGNLQWNDFIRKKIAATEKELLEEQEAVAHLLT